MKRARTAALLVLVALATGLPTCVRGEEAGAGHYVPGAAASFIDALPGRSDDRDGARAEDRSRSSPTKEAGAWLTQRCPLTAAPRKRSPYRGASSCPAPLSAWRRPPWWGRRSPGAPKR